MKVCRLGQIPAKIVTIVIFTESHRPMMLVLVSTSILVSTTGASLILFMSMKKLRWVCCTCHIKQPLLLIIAKPLHYAKLIAICMTWLMSASVDFCERLIAGHPFWSHLFYRTKANDNWNCIDLMIALSWTSCNLYALVDSKSVIC